VLGPGDSNAADWPLEVAPQVRSSKTQATKTVKIIRMKKCIVTIRPISLIHTRASSKKTFQSA